MAPRRRFTTRDARRRDPLWYKDAIIYEVHVRAFHDSDGDGVGDFRGLTEKLDYLQDLGVTAIWLLPFYPSPLRDDGYDIADYTDVHPTYGTLRDVEVFLHEAHRRGLRVITELVLNHTSDQHPWFQRARRAKPGSAWRDFYVWAEDTTRYADARIIFKDFEASNWTWDAVAGAHYWHRFYSHQPDLNFDSPRVRKAVMEVLDFWARLGVDGFRLDAVPYLYEREGTNCENLPETHAFLRTLRRHMDETFGERMLLAEANQWPEDAAAYFGGGDECHMAFHFPIMPRLFMSMRMEDRYPLIDMLAQTPPIPETCQWAVFLRNHDELTLEMVTDEERAYMYRVYAQDPQSRINLGIRRRLAPLLGNHRRRIELLNGLLFSLPGTPVIYYGDEIGMGDNIYLGDRNGVRTPMQWSADRNAGFSRAGPQQLYLPVVSAAEYHPEAVNVETQQQNPHSLLWWTKRMIALRKRHPALSRGPTELLHPENRKVLVFVRSHGSERILVVANLSRFVEYVELDLSAYRGFVPVELFGSTPFPPIGELPYFITLGPHAFYWFALTPPRTPEVRPAADGGAPEPPALAVEGEWEEILQAPARGALEDVLRAYLPGRRWFGGKARRIRSIAVAETIRVPMDGAAACVALVRIGYVEGEAETYVVPLAFAADAAARELEARSPGAVVARLQIGSGAEGIVYDALADRGFQQQLLDGIARHRRFKGAAGELVAAPTRALRQLRGGADANLEPTPLRAEQSNTSILFGDRFILKFFRRVQDGINPDVEIGRFLTERTPFVHTPPLAGTLVYERSRAAPTALGILHGYVANQGDAWRYTLHALDQYFEQVLARPAAAPPAVFGGGFVAAAAAAAPPEPAGELIGPYLEAARLLGQRTAELHLALASATDDPDFRPEAFSTLYQRSLYQSARSLGQQVLDLLRRQRPGLPVNARADAERLLGAPADIDRRLRAMLARKLTGLRIRVHGDYHLGQVLSTGRDFVILDFEGEPERSITERRLKRSPLRDVAGMLRSYHYAAYTALFDQHARGLGRPGADDRLEPWARFWYTWVTATFLRGYLAAASHARILPASDTELEMLLGFYMLEKALYELRYELNNRPDWALVPLRGIVQIVETGAGH